MSGGRIPALLLSLLRRLEDLSGRIQPHLRTGRRGEDLAWEFLRRQGYTLIARNWRSRGRRGEVDIIGWDGDVLCFVEVKTRSSHLVATADSAVDQQKRRELRGMAALFQRRHHPRARSRFDVVAVYLLPGQAPQIELFKHAFPWRTMSASRRM